MFNFANMFGGMKPGAEGWTTSMATGSGQKGFDALMNPLVKNTDGKVTGLSDPFMQTVGGAFQAAGGAMPGGTPVASAMQGPQDPMTPQMPARPQKMGAFAPSADQGPGPASWLKPYTGA